MPGDATGEPYLELAGISKKFGSFTAVDGVSLAIPKGEFVTLLGPSGCGKTTTLRMVAGFLTPDSGQIFIKGNQITNVPAYLRNTGMVFQSYALFPHMTVFENIAFGLRMRHFSQQEIVGKVRNVLELVEMQGVEARYPRQLSGGQQQRIALARALVIEPDVLLLDEPLSNLDLKLRNHMRLEIKKIHRRIEITTLYVTHDQGEALIMSDKLVVMHQGKILQVGDPTEVYEHPKTRFIAEFIGESNYLAGKVLKRGDDGVVIGLEDGMEVVANPESGETAEGQTAGICVRPERIQISRNPNHEKNSFWGVVEQAVYQGSNVRYFIRVGQHGLVVDKQIVEAGASFKQGDKVLVEWSVSNCLLLEKG